MLEVTICRLTDLYVLQAYQFLQVTSYKFTSLQVLQVYRLLGFTGLAVFTGLQDTSIFPVPSDPPPLTSSSQCFPPARSMTSQMCSLLRKNVSTRQTHENSSRMHDRQPNMTNMNMTLAYSNTHTPATPKTHTNCRTCHISMQNIEDRRK